MPQALLNSVSFDPPLPPLKNQLIQRMPMGSVIKTVTFYERAFWREKGLNGVLISDSGPAYVTVDDTKPDGSYPAIMRLVTFRNISFRSSISTIFLNFESIEDQNIDLFFIPCFNTTSCDTTVLAYASLGIQGN